LCQVATEGANNKRSACKVGMNNAILMSTRRTHPVSLEPPSRIKTAVGVGHALQALPVLQCPNQFKVTRHALQQAPVGATILFNDEKKYVRARSEWNEITELVKLENGAIVLNEHATDSQHYFQVRDVVRHMLPLNLHFCIDGIGTVGAYKAYDNGTNVFTGAYPKGAIGMQLHIAVDVHKPSTHSVETKSFDQAQLEQLWGMWDILLKSKDEQAKQWIRYLKCAEAVIVENDQIVCTDLPEEDSKFFFLYTSCLITAGTERKEELRYHVLSKHADAQGISITKYEYEKEDENDRWVRTYTDLDFDQLNGLQRYAEYWKLLGHFNRGKQQTAGYSKALLRDKTLLDSEQLKSLMQRIAEMGENLKGKGISSPFVNAFDYIELNYTWRDRASRLLGKLFAA